jgi:hypothetical protein
MVVNFSKSLYNGKSIKEAVSAYAQLADFAISETKEDFNVEIRKIEPEFKDIIREEFCNYVLSLMKK